LQLLKNAFVNSMAEAYPLPGKMETNSQKVLDDGRAWFAVQAKTTHEKRVASLLSYQNYECFLPLYTCRRRWSDRIKQVELALFPGYVFCRFDHHLRGPILRTPSVTGVVGIGGKPAPIDPAEIAAIERAASSGLGVRPHPFLQVGQHVRIEGGALDGLEGLIVDTSRRNRLVISVTLLQRSVSVDIDSGCVAPIHLSRTQPIGMKPAWLPV
jgi:transcription antitermination factor NusG